VSSASLSSGPDTIKPEDHQIKITKDPDQFATRPSFLDLRGVLELGTRTAGTGDSPMRARDPGRVPTSSTPCPQFWQVVSPLPAHRVAVPAHPPRSTGPGSAHADRLAH